MRSSRRQAAFFFCLPVFLRHRAIYAAIRHCLAGRTIHAPFYSRFHSFIIASFAFCPHNAHTAVCRQQRATLSNDKVDENVDQHSDKERLLRILCSGRALGRLNRICIACAAPCVPVAYERLFPSNKTESGTSK